MLQGVGLSGLTAFASLYFAARKWGTSHEIVALAGALVTGLGCALVFPALGVEGLKRVLPAVAAWRDGAFVAFFGLAYGLSGPSAGVIAGQFGYACRLPVRHGVRARRGRTRDPRTQRLDSRKTKSRIFISGSSTGLGMMAAQ